MDIKIIPPGGDLAEPMRIREEVFTIEQGFAAPDSDSYDPVATHVMVYLDSVPAATGRFYADGDTFHPGRVAVRKAFRGTGLGRVVMEALEQEARRQGAKKLRLGAQLYARPFYERCGYHATGERYMDEFCEHEYMEKELPAGE